MSLDSMLARFRGGIVPEARKQPASRTETITVTLSPRDRANGIGSGGGIVPGQRDARPKYIELHARALHGGGGIVSSGGNNHA